MCQTPFKLLCCCCCVIVVDYDDHVIVVAVNPRNLPLKFGQKWVCKSWGVGVVVFSVVDCVVVIVDPRNLPLKFGQKRVSNSWDINDIKFWLVGGVYEVVCKVIFVSNPTKDMLGWS